jgi:hypothetical protein
MPICRQCGLLDETPLMLKRKAKGLSLLCVSCRARPAYVVQTKFGVCRPHHGNFDEFENPLDDDGFLFRAGERLCGNSDCVEPSHIDPAKPSRASDADSKLVTDEILRRLRESDSK